MGGYTHLKSDPLFDGEGIERDDSQSNTTIVKNNEFFVVVLAKTWF